MTWFAYLILGLSIVAITVIVIAPSQRYRIVRWRKSLRRTDG